MNLPATFRSVTQAVPAELKSIPPETARQSRKGGWSAAQELGHLLDSAIMNHARIIRVLTEETPALPDYDGNFCVAAHAYATRDWLELVTVWEALNRHFLMAIDRISADDWRRSCVFGGETVTLEFVVSDYLRHALHHLAHIGIDVHSFQMQLVPRS